MEMSAQTFTHFRDLIYENSGIFFPENKKYLLDSRLASRLIARHCENFEDYLALLKTERWDDKELGAVLNAVITNETFFFRDVPQLEAFNDLIIPAILKENQSVKRMRIWSAACSTGDEAYTLAILLLERAQGKGGCFLADAGRVGEMAASGREGAIAGEMAGQRTGMVGATAAGAGGCNNEGAERVKYGLGLGKGKAVLAALGWKGGRASAIETGCTGELSGWDMEITASDISEETLATARRGSYGSYAVRHVPPSLASRYFTVEDGLQSVTPEVKRLVRFAQINLLDEGRMKSMRAVDVIFCRNCLIYFDDKAKKRVIESFSQSLNAGGYLVTGFSESLHALTRAFRPISFNKTIVYQKVQ